MNPNDLMEKLGLTAEEMSELISLFVDTCQQDLQRMAAALESQDPRGVSEAAHSIKGAAGNMRFEQIYELARNIEDDARQRDLTGIGAHLEEIRTAVGKIGKQFDIPPV